MAQLVKLQDYTSRYQIDLKRYPTQFVRLKLMQWERMKKEWESGEDLSHWKHENETEEVEEKSRNHFFKKMFSFSRKKKEQPWEQEHEQDDEWQEGIPHHKEMDGDDIPEELSTLDFEPNILYHPQSMEELKRMYIDQLFHFQLKWASSTLREKSYVDPKYHRDSLLRALTQNLPDSYLLFYYPIFQLKKAPIEMGIILLTPTDCLCIQVLEEEDQAAFIGSGDRFWLKKVGKTDKKVLSPLISLKRMESILKQLFSHDQIDIPIHKIVLSRNGYIDYPGSTYGVNFIDKRKFPEWFSQLKRNPSPMKHMQFKAAQTLLNTVQTTSFHRTDWDMKEAENDK
ncbi:NERD domain-containing protein [Viridibacillus sp. YIM B01967]|uniref:NERD domain-containing protein n=1 Tax=Viridibacillus soli TaxID=2798301 RepID=A0ABS1H9T4_9BACL|nr:NERD domain-containing protein [Viridibacillus soli]MBK3496064.1 NERD domain-containing protein [Viridibacillus soli]